MSKHIEVLPLSRVRRIQIYINTGRRTLADIRRETGADYLINGGLYNPDWTACALLKADGVMGSKTPWREWGFGWNTGPDIALRTDHERVENFLSCVTLRRGGQDTALRPNAALDGVRGRSAIGLTDKGLLLYCAGDGTGDALTPEALQKELGELGCTDAIMLDGGGSSQCDFNGRRITSSRVVQNLLLFYTDQKGEAPPDKEKNGMSEKKIVCLDPGHGPDTVNGSPDGSYKEKEFTWDMYRRIRSLLEKQGITVVGTREEAEKPSLTARAQVSNSAAADLFASLHSNAAGNSGWYNARGFLVYTSAPGGERSQAAAAIINRAHAAGVLLHGSGLAHEMWTVLAKTTAPAVLIEYGFHTSAEDVLLLKDSAYRDKLAQVTAQGVCDFLGMHYAAEDREEGMPDMPDSWAASAWASAREKGVLDGTRPRDNLTRQELAVVLARLGWV